MHHGAKRLELLRDLIPQATAIATLVNLNYPSAFEVQEAEAGARSLGLQLHVLNATTESKFQRAFAAVVAQRMAGLLVGDDPFLQSRRDQLV
jgi:putative tryptophan/tyrosine transport system substrate-binding protein